MADKNSGKLAGIFENGYGTIAKKIMQDKDLDVEAKGIYAYLASYTGTGKTAFPSINLMCDHLQMSENRFYKYRKQLLDKGYITIVKHKEDGKWQNNIYTLEPYPQIEGIENEGTQNEGMENKGTNNNSSNNNSINNNNNKSNMSSKEDDEIKEVWQQYKSIFADYYKPRSFSKKRKGKIKQRLQSYSVEELVNAMKAIAANDYMIGKNNNGKFYAKPEYCFRNDEKVEEWLNDYESSESNFEENIDYYADLRE